MRHRCNWIGKPVATAKQHAWVPRPGDPRPYPESLEAVEDQIGSELELALFAVVSGLLVLLDILSRVRAPVDQIDTWLHTPLDGAKSNF
jgi:hypothetical protein